MIASLQNCVTFFYPSKTFLKMKTFAFLLVLVLVVTIVRSQSIHPHSPLPLDASEDVVSLQVDTELRNEVIHLKDRSRTYCMPKLSPSSHYEVRISYPSRIPIKFSIDIADDGGFKASSDRRTLLNTDKVMFQTDSGGKMIGHSPSQSCVVVSAVYAGLSPSGTLRTASYNIVLETLFHGAPYSVFNIVAFVAGCAVGAYLLLRPVFQVLLQ
eukprot:TRINITY_DN860_c0_g2_i2.p1 TRINITY_DN860_c0_g2~~TRINITY_DN860_c0_g2_i2.p1  ORF type:complete len:212 (-),score=20.47 TRINITY_DN860_c0_g2_i2:249-884(-)